MIKEERRGRGWERIKRRGKKGRKGMKENDPWLCI